MTGEIHIPFNTAQLKFIKKDDKQFVFDVFRKKYVVFTPEEMVRQIILHYLVAEKGYPAALISVEKTVQGSNFRYDAVVHNRRGEAVMVIECKKPGIELNEKTLLQISNYNIRLKVPYWLISNGPSTYCISLKHNSEKIQFLPSIPAYQEL